MVSVLLISCTESKEKQLVSNHEQRIGNTITDLNLKFQKFEFVKDYMAKDSLEYLTEYFNEKKEEKINDFKKTKNLYQEYVEDYQSQLKKARYEEVRVLIRGYIADDEKRIKDYDKSIALYNGDCKGTFLEPVLIKINAFESKPDSIVAKEYDVTYTILNPILNNVKQTLSKTYYTNSDITKILKVETKEL